MPSIPAEWAAMADEIVDLGEEVLKLSSKLDAMNAVLLSIDARLAALQPTSATGEPE